MLIPEDGWNQGKDWSPYNGRVEVGRRKVGNEHHFLPRFSRKQCWEGHNCQRGSTFTQSCWMKTSHCPCMNWYRNMVSGWRRDRTGCIKDLKIYIWISPDRFAGVWQVWKCSERWLFYRTPSCKASGQWAIWGSKLDFIWDGRNISWWMSSRLGNYNWLKYQSKKLPQFTKIWHIVWRAGSSLRPMLEQSQPMGEWTPVPVRQLRV